MIDGNEEQGLKESCKTCGMKATFSVLPIGRRDYKQKISKNRRMGAWNLAIALFFLLLHPLCFLHVDCKNNQRNKNALPVSFT